MRILIMTAITAVALPFMALGQTTEEPQQTQEQTKERRLLRRRKGRRCIPRRSRANRRQNLRQGRTYVDKQTSKVALRT